MNTPGPWKLKNDHSLSKFIVGKYAESTDNPDDFWGRTIAHIPYAPATLQLMDEANARLIAAAPDLLEALKSAVEMLEIENNIKPEFLSHFRAIIATAEGI